MRPEPLLVQGEAESTRIDIAEANVDKAAAKVDTIKALVDQLTITAPIASQIPVEEGEVVTPGLPLLSLVDLSDIWLGFSLREDLIAGLEVGDRFTVNIPALGNREVTGPSARRARPPWKCAPS